MNAAYDATVTWQLLKIQEIVTRCLDRTGNVYERDEHLVLEEVDRRLGVILDHIEPHRYPGTVDGEIVETDDGTSRMTLPRSQVD